MNVLVITPLYHIVGRPELFHDTSSIHYLIRPWAREHNVIVINIYFESLRNISRYISRKQRVLRNGYNYNVDNVKVGMIEVLKPYKQGSRLVCFEKRRVIEYILNFTKENNFDPDIVISHIPIATINAVYEIYTNVPHVAVLHSTDRLYWNRNVIEQEKVRKKFDRFFSRSEDLKRFFENQRLSRLDSEIIYSGGKKANLCLKKDNKRLRIMYAGKFIPRKHVDVVIEALSRLQNSYDFLFEIYGDGSERCRLEELASNLLKKNSYVFKGNVEHEVILSAMTENDFFVMISENECFGLTYVEAMVNGCIPIATAGEGIDGVIIDGQNGYLVKKNSIDDLEKKLRYCFDMPELEKSRIMEGINNSAAIYSEKNAGLHYFYTLCNADNYQKD